MDFESKVSEFQVDRDGIKEAVADIKEKINGPTTQLRAYEDALQKGGSGEGVNLYKSTFIDVNTLTQGQPVANSPFNAVIPQDLSDSIYVAQIDSKKTCPLISDLNTDPAFQVLKERVHIESWGDDLVPSAFAEGDAPAENTASYKKILARVRYYGELGKASHQATFVNTLGGFYPTVKPHGRNALAIEQRQCLEQLTRSMEQEYWRGDESYNPNSNDGFLKVMKTQGKAGVNYIDKRGADLTFSDIIDAVGAVSENGLEGQISTLYISASSYKSLSKEALTLRRIDGQGAANVAAGTGRFYYAQDVQSIVAIGPYGNLVQMKMAPYMIGKDSIPDNSVGIEGISFQSLVTGDLVGGGPSAAAAGVGQVSQFVAADAGLYTYKIMPVFSKGRGKALETISVAVTAGDVVSFDINDQTKLGSKLGYEVWRSTRNSTTSFKYLGKFGVNTAGTSGTLFIDDNSIIPGSGAVAGIDHTPGAIWDSVLLPAFSQPLAMENSAFRTLYGSYRGLSVDMPQKHFAFINVGDVTQ